MPLNIQAVVVPPGQGDLVNLGGLGVHFKIDGAQTGGRFSIVEHPIEARRLIPPHVHSNVDEYSFVIEGVVGARIGDEIVEGGPGTYIVKPRNVPHTFWNPTDQPARLLEIISPAGFENYFRELGKMIEDGTFSPEARAEAAARYGSAGTMTSWSGDWIVELKAKFGLKLLGE
jgi:mannose-6-phosphate isomerase-like protein (cupin superfamily)